MDAIGQKREELHDVPGMEAKHERGAGNIPVGRAEEDEDGKGGGSEKGEKGMGEKGEGETLVCVPKTGKAEKRFANPEEGKGVEGMVDFEAHGKVAGSVLKEPEKEGGGKTGKAPKTPNSDILRWSVE